MKSYKIFALILIILMAFSVTVILADDSAKTNTDQEKVKKEIKEEDKLVVIWSSGDREVALKMVFMYTYNSIKFDWWKDVTLVVWGPSAKLLTEDKELQDYVKKMKDIGITLKACKGCADQYGVSEKLEKLGITVKYMGEITDYLKNGRHVLTF